MSRDPCDKRHVKYVTRMSRDMSHAQISVKQLNTNGKLKTRLVLGRHAGCHVTERNWKTVGSEQKVRPQQQNRIKLFALAEGGSFEAGTATCARAA
jgi:hypothetical protein